MQALPLQGHVVRNWTCWCRVTLFSRVENLCAKMKSTVNWRYKTVLWLMNLTDLKKEGHCKNQYTSIQICVSLPFQCLRWILFLLHWCFWIFFSPVLHFIQCALGPRLYRVVPDWGLSNENSSISDFDEFRSLLQSETLSVSDVSQAETFSISDTLQSWHQCALCKKVLIPRVAKKISLEDPP